MNIRKALILTFVLLGIFSALGLVAFLKTGVYDIAASEPHIEVERRLIITMKNNAINFQSMGTDTMDLSDPRLIEQGAKLYVKNCQSCHGGPGVPREAIGIGLNPNPPPLVKARENLEDREILWILINGLKMAGMPGYGDTHTERELNAMTAFVKRMATLAPKEYKRFLRGEEIEWKTPDQGWEKLKKQGDPKKGKKAFSKYGCAACHSIPGVPGAVANVGAPLDGWSSRVYLAGSVINNPKNMAAWLVDPQDIDPDTLMPDMNVSEEDAWDMAAYLFTLKY